MNDQTLKFPKFYMTAPSPCPYLEGFEERKLFTELDGPDAQDKHEAFNRIGFRRSQNIVYKPACENCRACVSVRVVVDDFRMSKSMRRNYKKFKSLVDGEQESIATYEQFELLKEYLLSRHGQGGMADMDEFEYADMVESSPITTRVVEYRERAKSDRKYAKGPLAGATLTDVLSDGLSMVYSFYRPEKAYSGFGIYMILDHILKAKKAGLSYIYLGFWVKGSKSMAYKSRFQPLEMLTSSGWRPFSEDRGK